MLGGAYNPRFNTGDLYRLSHLFHHIARLSNYDSKGNLKDIKFEHLETLDGKNFYPFSEEYDILWRKLKKPMRKVTQRIVILKNGKKLNQRTAMGDVPYPDMYFRALGDHIWGFLKNKDGDLEKNLTTIGKRPIGHTIGTGIHARKIAELVSTMLLLNHGLTIKQIYQNKNSAGRYSSLSLSQKIMLLHILDNATWSKTKEKSKKAFIAKFLVKTPVDLLMNNLFKDKYYKNLLSKSKMNEDDLISDMEFIRELGNLAAHAGQPGIKHKWTNLITDEEQDELAGALVDILEYMLDSMKISYRIKRSSQKFK
jgi:hypothetical protein